MMPQRVHTIRGPKRGTGTSSGHGSTLSTAAWWQSMHDTASERTPRLRMLPTVERNRKPIGTNPQTAFGSARVTCD